MQKIGGCCGTLEYDIQWEGCSLSCSSATSSTVWWNAFQIDVSHSKAAASRRWCLHKRMPPSWWERRILTKLKER